MEKKRLSIEISDQDQERMHLLIPRGLTSHIMRILLKSTLDLVEKHGDIVLGFVLSGQISILDLLKKGVPEGGITGFTEDAE